MNFGVKITILYLSFVALILTLVFMCFGQKVELVSADYYAQEIKFQDRINATNNEKNLTNSITHNVSKEQITLTLDSVLYAKSVVGTVVFFRPSDSSKDIKLPMKFERNQQIIPTSKLIHGAYKLQLTWVSNNTSYFKEDVVFIN